MDCIACKEPMIVLEVDRVEVDYCLACKGVWLDSGELELLFESKEEISQIVNNLWQKGQRQKGQRNCPVCGKRMDEITIQGKRQITIDSCPSGHGNWFDRGELEDVVANLEGDNQTKVANLLRNTFRF